MNDKEAVAEWTMGYREGWSEGYTQGLAIGRSQGWDDAKWRAMAALEADDIRVALTEHLGQMQVVKD